MNLINNVNLVPLLRPLGIPQNINAICMICLKNDLNIIASFIQAHPWLKVEGLVIPDLSSSDASRLHIECNGKALPVFPPEWLGNCPQLEKVFICPDHLNYMAPWISQICIFLASVSVQTLWLYASRAPEHSLRQALPDFLEKHGDELAKTIRLFSDDFSKSTYIGRIRAILTGNAAYIPIAPHREYFHPLVKPEDGDIMIDGGVSDMVGCQKEFINAVGVKGRIFGFEPIPQMAAKAKALLGQWPAYMLQCLGLAQKDGAAVFDNLRDSSHIANTDNPLPGQIRCELTSIDNFCSKNHLGRIDCIKLDVEGAELSALKGAENTITRCHPRLIICLYHKPEDMYEIPIWIKELVPEYELFLAHSSCQFMDTVLYARFPH